jgi:Na+/melibiose symporter-like transporter
LLAAVRRPGLALGGALACLPLDYLVYYEVVVAPSSSTSAIIMVSAWMMTLLFALPVGVLLAFALDRLLLRRVWPGLARP